MSEDETGDSGPQLRDALGALSAALVQLRRLASEGVEGTGLVDLLDLVEYLPRLLAHDEDRTDEFRKVLVDLAARRADFQLALDRFDRPSSPLVSTSISIASGVASDRSVPEDAVRVVQTDELVAFVVADGAGGLGGGARAAHLVIEGFEDEMKNVSPAVVTPEKWCRFLLQRDQRVHRDRDAGESTAVVAVIRDGHVVGASVGDSEAWMVAGDGNYEVLTSGQHKSRLGSGRATPVGFQAPVGNSVIIAATDGLFHTASADAICSVLRAAPTPEKLVALARSRSGKLYDDLGLVIVSIA